MRVKKIMSKKVERIGPEAMVTLAARKMRDLNIGFLPVTNGQKLVGVLTDRDVCCRAVADGLDPASLPVGKIMSTKPVWCREEETIEDAAYLMENEQRQRLPVLNRDEELVGVLSIADIAVKMPHGFAGEVIEAVSRPAMAKTNAPA